MLCLSATIDRIYGLFAYLLEVTNSLSSKWIADRLPDSCAKPPSPMNAMDHGPFVSSTISHDPLSTRSIFVYKGIAVKVGEDRDAVMVFDTDLLRVASAWTDGFLKWYPARDGLQEFPSPDGYTHFSTSQRPGWSLDGNFADPRPWRYGPIPSTLGAYKGLFRDYENWAT